MGAIASQITSLTIVYSTVDSDADQRKHQSSASLAFMRGIHRGPVNSQHKWPVTRKMFPFDDAIMIKCEPNVLNKISILWIVKSSTNITLFSSQGSLCLLQAQRFLIQTETVQKILECGNMQRFRSNSHTSKPRQNGHNSIYNFLKWIRLHQKWYKHIFHWNLFSTIGPHWF